MSFDSHRQTPTVTVDLRSRGHRHCHHPEPASTTSGVRANGMAAFEKHQLLPGRKPSLHLAFLPSHATRRKSHDNHCTTAGDEKEAREFRVVNWLPI